MYSLITGKPKHQSQADTLKNPCKSIRFYSYSHKCILNLKLTFGKWLAGQIKVYVVSMARLFHRICPTVFKKNYATFSLGQERW